MNDPHAEQTEPGRAALTPALTPEEWIAREYSNPEMDCYVEFSRKLDGGEWLTISGSLGGTSTEPKDRHAIAALCLYQQPFGFSQEDVELMRRCADGADFNHDDEDDDLVFPDGITMRMKDVKRFRSLANRIAALLPPQVVAPPSLPPSP